MAGVVLRATQTQRQHLGMRHASQYLFNWLFNANLGLPHTEQHHMGKAQSTAQFILPFLYPFHRNAALGKKGQTRQTHLSIWCDESTKRRQTNEKRLANCTACRIWKNIGQTPHAKTVSVARTMYSGCLKPKRLDFWPLYGQRHNRRSRVKTR